MLKWEACRAQPGWVTQLRHRATKQAVDLQFIRHAILIDRAVWFGCCIRKSHQTLSSLWGCFYWIVADILIEMQLKLIFENLSCEGHFWNRINMAGNPQEGPGAKLNPSWRLFLSLTVYWINFKDPSSKLHSWQLNLEPQKHASTVSVSLWSFDWIQHDLGLGATWVKYTPK